MAVNRSSTIETEALPLRKQARKTLSRKFWVATIAIAGILFLITSIFLIAR
jgi:hypothetical protein